MQTRKTITRIGKALAMLALTGSTMLAVGGGCQLGAADLAGAPADGSELKSKIILPMKVFGQDIPPSPWR